MMPPYRTIQISEHYRSRPRKRSASEKYAQKTRRRKRKSKVSYKELK